MKTIGWAWILLMSSLTLQVGPAAAQSGSGAWYGVSVGGGYLGSSCDSCDGSGQAGYTWGLHGGGYLSPSTAWGVEASAFYDLDGGGYPWLGALGLLLRWTPSQTRGGFVKVGAGWGWFKGLVPVGQDPPRANGFQGEVGGGWDFQAGEAVTLSPFVDFMLVPSTTVEDPQESLSERVTGYLVQFGIAVSHF